MAGLHQGVTSHSESPLPHYQEKVSRLGGAINAMQLQCQHRKASLSVDGEALFTPVVREIDYFLVGRRY